MNFKERMSCIYTEKKEAKEVEEKKKINRDSCLSQALCTYIEDNILSGKLLALNVIHEIKQRITWEMERHPATTISGTFSIYWTTTPYPGNVAYILEYFLTNNGILPENFELKVFEDSLYCDLPYYTEIKLSKYASVLEDYGLLLAWNYAVDGAPLSWIIHDDFRLFQSSISYKNHFIKKEYCCTITFTDYGKRFYDTLFGLAQADGIKLMLLNPKVGVSYDGEKWSAQNSTHTLYGEIATSGKTFSIKKILPKNEDLNEYSISSELTDIDTGYSITI